MLTKSPVQMILTFLQRLPETVQENICAMAVLIVDRDHRPGPEDRYLNLARGLLTQMRNHDERRAAILVAGVLDHHLSDTRGLTSDDYLALAKQMPTELFQMGVLQAPQQNRDFAEASDEWHELRAGDLSHKAIAAYYMR